MLPRPILIPHCGRSPGCGGPGGGGIAPRPRPAANIAAQSTSDLCRFNVMFVAVNRPPGCIAIMTRPSPDLFGLIDATSKAGPVAGVCGDWACRRHSLNTPNAAGATAAITAVTYPRRILTVIDLMP